MRLPKLKQMFKNKFKIRMAAGALTLAVVLSGTCVYTVYGAKPQKEIKELTTVDDKDNGRKKESDSGELENLLKENQETKQQDAGKEETVYIIADNTGKSEKVIVSNWLKNEKGSKTIEDVSELKDITNVKGNETFEQNGKKLIWNADGKDIYYQGTTKKQAPITEEITYYLDGKEISPKKIAGKSGKVKIRFDYVNHEKTKTMVNGIEEEMTVPFVVLSGMVLDDSFTNVEVSNGKVVSDGKRNIAVGITMPGLKESLQVEEGDFKEEVNMPDYFEVSADVEKFTLDMTMTVATGNADLNVNKTLDLSDVDSRIEELTGATGQLMDGSSELAEGMDTLKNSLGTFGNGVASLKNGVSTYTQGAAQVADGIETLKEQSVGLVNGVGDLGKSTASLNQGVKMLDEGLKTPMTEEEKAEVGNLASAQADQAVESQFADESNPESYQNLKNYAAQTFYDSVANPDSISGAVASVRDNAAGQIAAKTDTIAAAASDMAKGAVSGQMAGSPQIEEIKQAVIAAGIVTAAQAAGTTDIAVIMNNEGAMGEISANAEQMVASLVGMMEETAGAAASETAKSVASQVAPEAAGMAASAVIENIAGQAKDSVGEAVAKAAKTAAKTAAQNAAAQGAVAGAEAAKERIAGQIEAKDEKTGYSLVSGMDALNQGVTKMSANMPTLSGGIDSLYSGSRQLVSNNEALNNGAGELEKGTADIAAGVGQLGMGAHELADGVVQFNEEGIERLVNSYNGDVKSFADRIEALMEAGNAYQTYTGKADQVTGSVKFIIKTEGV